MLSSLQLKSFIKTFTIGKSHRNRAAFSPSLRTLKISSVKPLPSTATDEIHQNEYLFGTSPTPFSEIEKLHPMLVKSLTYMSRIHATCIQNKALSSLLTNNDVVISSETGSGKTTIINLINRFYAFQKGSIRIDDRDINTFDVQAIRNNVAIVLQDVFLFSSRP